MSAAIAEAVIGAPVAPEPEKKKKIDRQTTSALLYLDGISVSFDGFKALNELSFVVEPGSDPGVPTIRVPMHDVVEQVCGADLVKLDIEGGEWEILADPRFAQHPPRALVLEYHPHMCPGADPRAEVERLLADARMSVASIWHRDDGYGMLWAWRG